MTQKRIARDRSLAAEPQAVKTEAMSSYVRLASRRRQLSDFDWRRATACRTYAIAFIAARRLIERRSKSWERNQLYLLLRAAP